MNKPHLIIPTAVVPDSVKNSKMRCSTQVKLDLYHCQPATKAMWLRQMTELRIKARADGHELDGWAARLIMGNDSRYAPAYFLAVCKRCRGVFIAEKPGNETHWLAPYGACRAVPRKVVIKGGKVMVTGEVLKAGITRKFI